MSWVLLSFFSAIAFSLVNIIDKIFLVHYVRSPRAAVGILGFFSLCFSVIFFLFNPVTIFNGRLIAVLIVSGIFEAVYIYYYLQAIESDEVGYLIPLFGLSPVIVFLVSFLFFHTPVDFTGVMGMSAIIVGIFILVIARFGPKRFTFNRPFWLMVTAAFFYALQGMLLDYASSDYGWLDELTISRFGAFCGAAIILFTRPQEAKVFLKFKSYIFFFSEALYVLATYLFIAAIAKGHAFYILSILNIQPLAVLFISYIFYRLWPDLLDESFSWFSKPLAFLSVSLVIVGAIFLL